jgi:hypothetical protein
MAFNQSLSFTNLGTITVGCPEAATYNVDVKCQIPTLTNGGGVSALVIVIKHNTSTVYTGSAGALGAWTQVSGVAAGDTISVVTSSSNAADEGLNAIQGYIAISDGPGY